VLALALWERTEPVYNIEVEGDHCSRVGSQGLLVHNMSPGNPNPVRCIPGTPGGTPPSPPSKLTSPPPPTPHFTPAELSAIVVATSTGTAITAGGSAGGALTRLVASRGLPQAETAAQLEEGRDFIHWFFGAGAWAFNRISGNTGTDIIFEGVPAMPGADYPTLAIRTDGSIYRGSAVRHLIRSGSATAFDFAWNSNHPAKPDVLKIKVWQSSNWVVAP
jgi:hypothetical protein